jgi:hypothetical protein
VKIWRLLGGVLTVAVLQGGLLLVTARPAVACSCAMRGSDAQHAARADAVFVGTLISQVTQIDPRTEQAQHEFTRTSDPRVLVRALRNDTSRTVWTFQVSRVYKGAVGERQEIVAPPGGPSGANCSGVGVRHPGTEPFLVFASNSAGARYRLEPGQYTSNMCSGSRPLADGGDPDLGGLSAGEPGWPDSLVGVGALAVVVAAGLGLAVLRARRRASAD